MAQVKETIELLTKVLNRNGTSKIKAEIFRLAKFNDEDATESFWKLLFELLYFCKYGVIDEVTIKAYSELSREELAVYVKREMQALGFTSYAFSSLPNDMSQGSRELLLAFAWLLCKGSLIDKFMDKCASPVEEDLSVYQLNNLDDSNFNNHLTANKPLNPAQKVQHLQYLNGKLRSSLRRLYALQQQKNKLQHKILKLLEKDNDRLQCMLTWKKQEDVFWKWMMTFYNIPPDSIRLMNSARKQLEEAIMKYESVIVQLEEIWESQRDGISTQELDYLLASINMEISLQQANLALDDTETMLNHRDPHLSYIKANKQGKKLTNLTEPSRYSFESKEQNDYGVDVRTEISQLEIQLQRLENELFKKQSNYKTELDNMASNIPDVICIQPMSC
ncbi:hypothetical protein KUTeg_013989 [Tegillarca granosa]|uniref:Tubulin epsilon and delta complex protein 1 domain-containing protein n=1 Tax=Tegillarca granosa TaxID=220873 RepID=A0ABQ9EZ38_TEGGR|nr:hypothetical protein KUTeg_013989 [Tegillarca granosa]